MGHCLKAFKYKLVLVKLHVSKMVWFKTFGILVSDNRFSGTKLSINPLKVYYLALIKG